MKMKIDVRIQKEVDLTSWIDNFYDYTEVTLDQMEFDILKNKQLPKETLPQIEKALILGLMQKLSKRIEEEKLLD